MLRRITPVPQLVVCRHGNQRVAVVVIEERRITTGSPASSHQRSHSAAPRKEEACSRTPWYTVSSLASASLTCAATAGSGVAPRGGLRQAPTLPGASTLLMYAPRPPETRMPGRRWSGGSAVGAGPRWGRSSDRPCRLACAPANIEWSPGGPGPTRTLSLERVREAAEDVTCVRLCVGLGLSQTVSG